MVKNILGFVLVDTPHSALNNAGQDVGSKTDNAVVVKVIRKGRKVYPYISAQAWRYWWRNTLAEKAGWTLSPIKREEKIAFTSADPFLYPDDDVFGYMRAMKKAEGGTLTRLSPLKCSPLVSVYDNAPTNDFGVMSRQEGDPVPFEHQFYSTVMKGIFSLDISTVGVFHESAKTGYKNLDEKYVQKKEIQSSIQQKDAAKEGNQWKLQPKERLQRIKDTISVLPFIYSTTKGALHLTDVTPKFIILAVIEGGNHLFMNITNESTDQPVINVAALQEVLTDYKDSILSDIYIGHQEGFIDTVAKALSELRIDNKTIHLQSPKKTVEEFVKNLDQYIE